MSKVMLVEDDKSLREIYSIRLVAEGYDIVSASDGEEGLALAVKEKPDLIIADVMMPKISGFDMLDILRSTPETANVKVIMMTALSSDDQRQRGEALGANRYLVKSQVGIEDVVNTVHELLEDTPNANAGANLDTVAAIPTRPATADQPAVPGYEANQAMQNIDNTQLTTDTAQAQAQAAALAAAQAQMQAQAQTQAMEAPQMPPMPQMPQMPAQPAPVVPEVAQAPVAPAPAPAPVATPAVATAPVAPAVPETPAIAEAPIVAEAPVAPAPVAPAPMPIPEAAPVAPAPAPAPAPETPVTPAPAAPAMPEVPTIPEAPVAPAAPAMPAAPAITGAASSAMPDTPNGLEAPATPAVNSLAGTKTEGGERVIQPINDPTLQQNQEALTAEIDALLNSDEGVKKDNPFNAPTPPPLNVPDAPEIPVATDTSMEGTQNFLAQANDDFSAAVSEAPVAFSAPEEKESGEVDNSAVQNFEQNEVANAEAQMGLNSELIDEPSTDDVSNIKPIQPGYLNELTDQLSEDSGNTQSEIENPLAAAMARELADDPITQQAMERREQAEAEGEKAENNETILDGSDSDLPAFLRGDSDTPNLGPNIQSSDTPQGEEAAETVE